MGDTSPTTENTSSACELNSDVLPSKAAASMNVEQSDPVHPPSQTHTDVARHLPFALQSFGHGLRTDGAAVAASRAIGSFTAAVGALAAKPLREIRLGSAVRVALGRIVGSAVGSAVPGSTHCRGGELVGSWLGSAVGGMVCVGWMVVGISVSVGTALGGEVAADGACVVGKCEGIPVEGTADGRGVAGAALVGSTLGAGVVGANDGAIVDGTAVGGDDGYQEGLGDVGTGDGGKEGIDVGSRVGTSEGVGVGEGVRSEGAIEGSDEGAIEGSDEGGLVGTKLGLEEGARVGSWEG